MLRFFYSLLFTLATPLLVIRLLLRSRQAPAYRERMGERFAWRLSSALQGLLAQRQPGQPLVWIHAVSVGEAAAAKPLIDSLLAEDPKVLVAITTMTPTGAAKVERDHGHSPRVEHGYLPYDMHWAMQSFIGLLKPTLLILMETELWPNLLHVCAQKEVPAVLANGRLSERSARAYGKLPGLAKKMLSRLTGIAAQDEADAQRFIDLGADADCVTVTGSLKFYIEGNGKELHFDQQLDSIAQSQRRVVLAASTREGEESKVVTAFQQVLTKNENALLLLVPRHPERFAEVATLIEQRHLRLCRRSEGAALSKDHQVFLGDSMGEMACFVALADLAFVGGSLVDTGCQNVLEPAAAGLPVITGPSQFNFAVICEALQQAGGLLTVADEQALAQRFNELLEDDSRRHEMGKIAAEFVASNRQALPKLRAIVDPLLNRS